MGRAERRAKEKLERKKSGNNTYDQVMRAREEDLTKDISRIFLVCVAMAERKTYGFGQKRILKTLKTIDELMNDIFEGRVSIEDYERQLKDEVDISISVK